jgi:SAM-dependent methyltransferase
MLFIVVLIVIIISVIAIFAVPQFSPIPYFPTQKKDLPLIIKAFKLRNNQVIYDLGAGDGLVIFEAAKFAKRKRLNTQFVAVEINPILVMILNLKKLFNPNKKNIKIIWADLFKFKLDNSLTRKLPNITIYLYVSPWFLDKILSRLQSQFKNFSIVSYMYPIKSLKKKEKIIHGKNSIHSYVNLRG